mgnify:CR=1 FL=1
MKINKQKIYRLLFRLIGIVILLYILSNIDFSSLVGQFSNINIIYLFFGFILMLAVAVFKSLRWRSILESFNLRIGKLLSIKIYWLGLYVGIITPGKIGEVIKVYFLKARGFSSSKVLLSVIIDRILDLLVIMALGVIIAVFYLHFMMLQILILGLIVILLPCLLYYLFNRKNKLSKWLDSSFKKILNEKIYSHFSSFLNACLELKKINLRRAVEALFYLIISWALYYGANYMIALALHLQISPMLLLSAIVVAIVASLLPISIAGIGTRDASFIYIFSLAGINRETALIFSFLILIVDLLTVSFGLIPYLEESSLIARIKETDFKKINLPI